MGLLELVHPEGGEDDSGDTDVVADLPPQVGRSYNVRPSPVRRDPPVACSLTSLRLLIKSFSGMFLGTSQTKAAAPGWIPSASESGLKSSSLVTKGEAMGAETSWVSLETAEAYLLAVRLVALRAGVASVLSICAGGVSMMMV